MSLNKSFISVYNTTCDFLHNMCYYFNELGPNYKKKKEKKTVLETFTILSHSQSYKVEVKPSPYPPEIGQIM